MMKKEGISHKSPEQQFKRTPVKKQQKIDYQGIRDTVSRAETMLEKSSYKKGPIKTDK